MRIIPNCVNTTNFKSNNDNDTDDCYESSLEALRNHYSEYTMPYYSIYEKEGQKTDYQKFRMIKDLSSPNTVVSYNNILTLPLRNVKRIDGTENSYRGQTLVNANNQCLETIKKSGVKTVVDLIEYQGYDKKLANSGLEYFPFKMSGIWNSPMFESPYRYLDNQRRLFEAIKEEGINIDIEDSLKQSKENFNQKIRGPIDKFVDFINIMQGDNVYIGCEYGTYMTDVAMIFNNAFNPKRTNKAIEVENMQMFNDLWVLHSNLTKEDKQKMGWTEETEDRFLERMMDAQTKLLSIE